MKDDWVIIALVAAGAFLLIPRNTGMSTSGIGPGYPGYPPSFGTPRPMAPAGSTTSDWLVDSTASTWGSGIGAGVGALFGNPAVGSQVGSTLGPAIEKIGGKIGDFFGSIF